MFFVYRQMNAGGYYCAPAMWLIVEAPDDEAADTIARDLGVSFLDGCPCCGSRWHPGELASQYETVTDAMPSDPDGDEHQRVKLDKVPWCLIRMADGETLTF